MEQTFHANLCCEFSACEFQPLFGFLGGGMFYAPLKIQRRCTHLKAIRPSNFKQAVWGFFPLSWNPDTFFSLPLFSFPFFLFSGAPVIVLCSYKGYGISKLLPRKIYGPLLPESYHTRQLSSIPLPAVCFHSHLTVDKRAVQSYSVTGEQHHV